MGKNAFELRNESLNINERAKRLMELSGIESNRVLNVKFKYADDWGRKIYKDVNSKDLWADVDGVLHTISRGGEPDTPISQDVEVNVVDGGPPADGNLYSESEEVSEEASEGYPELDSIADELARSFMDHVNSSASKVSSKMPYKAQYILEKIVDKLSGSI